MLQIKVGRYEFYTTEKFSSEKAVIDRFLEMHPLAVRADVTKAVKKVYKDESNKSTHTTREVAGSDQSDTSTSAGGTRSKRSSKD